MIADPSCPDTLLLEQLMLGQLDEPAASSCEEHLSHCAHCVETLDRLETDGTFRAGLWKCAAATPRPAALQPDAHDGAVRRLIEQLRKLLPAALFTEALAVGGSGQESATDTVGRLGPYLVREELGRGGMGVVYRAEDVCLHRLVALKVLLPRVASDPNIRQRFLREARAAAAIEHERIATVFQVGEDRGVPFLAMQLLQGETLEARLARQPGPQPLPFVVRVGREIAEGLQAAHACGLVHRDIKPANIWLQEGGDHVKILDFGLTHLLQGSAPLTEHGMIVGTPGYLAPEQAAAGPVTERSDLFSLGVVLFRLATGRLPFQGQDPLSFLRALAVEQPPLASELNPALPPALAQLIASLLAREPKDRPHSARAVIEALDIIENNPCPPQSLPRRRRGWWPMLAGLVVASAVAVWLLISSRGRRQEKEPALAHDPANSLASTEPESSRPAGRRPHQEVCKRTFDHPLHAAVFCPDGEHILCGGDDQTVRLLEIATGREVKRYSGFTAPIRSLAVARDSGVFVTGGGYYVSGPNHTAIPKECRVQVWNLVTGAERARFEGHREPVHSVAISADGRRVLSACGHDSVHYWDVPSQRPLGLFGDDNGNGSVAMMPDGKRGLYISHGREICLLDLEKGVEVCRFDGMPPGRGGVLCLRFTPDGAHALAGCTHLAVEKDTLKPLECVLRLLDLQRGREWKRFAGHAASIRACACSRDGRFFLSGGGSGLRVGREVRMFDCSVRLWDAATGKELRRFEGHEAPVVAVDFSPDGHFGLSVGEDRTLRLWDLSR